MRYLDSRIALLIQNRMALDEVCTYLITGGALDLAWAAYAATPSRATS